MAGTARNPVRTEIHLRPSRKRPETRGRLLAFAIFVILGYFGLSLALVFWPASQPPGKSGKTLNFRNLPIISPEDMGSPGYYTARDGRRLFFRMYDSPSDRLLILLHGSGGDGRYLAKMASAIAASGAPGSFCPT